LKVRWSPLAVDRAVEQARRIAEDKPGAAERWIEGLFAAAEGLGRLPRSGRAVPEMKSLDLREISYGAYRVIYRIEAGQVSVLTVRHSRRLLDPTELNGE
jgi:plasmid stabilization system protein ParE